MIVHPGKPKELLISFLKATMDITRLHIRGHPIERCPSAKLLGVILSADLKWDLHVDSMCKKASKRLHQLVILKRCKAPPEQLLSVYKSQIRSVLEYACQVWHPGLTKRLSDAIESVQRRALRIIHPGVEYNTVLGTLNLQKLHDRRVHLCHKLFKDIVKPDHKLHKLLPEKRDCQYSLRSQVQFTQPRLRTKRARGSFVNWALFNLQ